MYYSWRKTIKNCQYIVCIRVHSLYIILCGSTFGFNYISNSVYIGLCQHSTSGFSFSCRKVQIARRLPVHSPVWVSSQICYTSEACPLTPTPFLDTDISFFKHFLFQQAVGFGVSLFIVTFWQLSGRRQYFCTKTCIFFNLNLFLFLYVITEHLALLKTNSP